MESISVGFLDFCKKKKFQKRKGETEDPQDHPAMDSDEQRDNIVWKESIEIVKHVSHVCIVLLTI